MGRGPIKTRASEAQEAASRAESERLALSRLADAVRDCRALGLAGKFTVEANVMNEGFLLLRLSTTEATTTLRNMCHGADS